MFLKKYDLFFSYRYVFRFLLLNKYGMFLNTNQIPFFKKLVIFFDSNYIKDLDDTRALNYFYFVRFFFGRNAVFYKINSTFHLGTVFYFYRVFVGFFF